MVRAYPSVSGVARPFPHTITTGPSDCGELTPFVYSLCMNRPVILTAVLLTALQSPARPAQAQDAPQAQTGQQQWAGDIPTLKQITAEPDWIARSPRNPRWLVDGSAIMYAARREGLVGRDFSDDYLIFMSSPDAQPAKITPDNPGPYFTADGDWSPDASLRLLTHSGDLFLYDAAARSTRQLTKTTARESSPFFLTPTPGADTRFAFYQGGDWLIQSLSSPVAAQAADIRYADAPKDPAEERAKQAEKRGILENQQRDLFQIISLEDQRDAMRQDDAHAWRDTDPTAVPGPFYLGDKRRSRGTWLGPSGSFLLVATAPSERSNDKRDAMPNYVTDDGYVSTRPVRPKVGVQTETPVAFQLLDLKNERVIDLPLDDLPTITDDPLAWLKDQPDADEPDDKPGEESGKAKQENTEPRPVSSMGARWSDSGRYAAFMLRSHDNKDRWIVIVDTHADEPAPICAHHLRDEAWINWNFNDFGFVPNPDNKAPDTLWYLSEESNYSHLYTYDPVTGATTQLTTGPFEVRSPVFTRDGALAYMRTNRDHPGVQELERLHMASGALTPLTQMGGTISTFRLSPDESKAVISYSDLASPPELYLLDLAPNIDSPDTTVPPDPVRLTHTITDLYRSFNLNTPHILAVPSSNTDQPIYTRLYLPDPQRFPGPRPIVVFSHGAGYTQHANFEWPYYFREHMFHSVLTDEGFIVLAPDFRASEGYGRDWRTAIYRDMGRPELADFKDCIDYAVANHDGDASRVGIYGGSYGGFMTLMAMFLEPDTYACGAALRSVTDWRHYNHGYTSNILNTPEIDPEAFDRSSPINYADGLQGHLLMLHGLQDDNVVAQDVIRLSQRLIELEKQNWELALHPIEPHAYHEPSSWLDQLRRIHKLFSEELLPENDN